ncbi:MAG: hypothetical protein KDA25_09315 [Phycisphaerales bacterium]|nr:hypothetical protein [Phycisphaerales bacterium]
MVSMDADGMVTTDESTGRAAFVDALTRTERYVLMLYYSEELTITEIGLVLDLSATMVRETLEHLQQLASTTIERPAAVTAA